MVFLGFNTYPVLNEGRDLASSATTLARFLRFRCKSGVLY